mgnify:CR=1 FL=1
MTEQRRKWKTINCFLYTVFGLLLFRQVWWMLFGAFNVDEFENLSVLWLMERGVFPFRDYFHTHLPVYNLILYPIYHINGPNAALPGLVRLFLFPVVLLVLFEVYLLGAAVTRQRLGGWLTMILFLAQPSITKSLAEMRPDTLTTPLVLGAVLLLWRYLNQSRRHNLYLVSVLFSLSLLFTQKAVFIILISAWAIERYHFRTLQLPAGERIKRMTMFGVLSLLPFTLAIAWLLWAKWVDRQTLMIILSSGYHYMDLAVWRPYRAYRLMVMGGSMAPVLLLAFSAIKNMNLRQQPFNFLMSGCVIMALVQLLIMKMFYDHMLILPSIFISLCAAWLLVRYPHRLIALLIVAAALTTNLVDRVCYSTREMQIASFSFIIKNIPDDQPVLDIMSGYSTFHPIVGKFLDHRPMLFKSPEHAEHTREVIKMVGQKKYGAVVVEPLSAKLPPGLLQLIERNYYPSEIETILLPRNSP